MAHPASNKSNRNGITMMQLCDMFPDEESARVWFEARVWPDGRQCPHCSSLRTHVAKHKFSPYRCTDCRRYFSVKTGTMMHKSHIPLRKWVFAIYLDLANLEGVSSLKLHRDIDVSQPAAWFMLQRIRKARDDDDDFPFCRPLEVGEIYFSGNERNRHSNRRHLRR